MHTKFIYSVVKIMNSIYTKRGFHESQKIKGIKGGVNLLNGMYLHNEDGSFSKEADAILRDGKPIHLNTLNKL